MGSNPAVPMESKELEKHQRVTSPVKRARVEGYMHSNGMKEALKDNDCSRGLVTVKPHTNRDSYIKSPAAGKREVWKPKISLKWHEPYRTPLTLQ